MSRKNNHLLLFFVEAKAKVDKPASKKSKVEKHKEEKKEKGMYNKTYHNIIRQ